MTRDRKEQAFEQLLNLPGSCAGMQGRREICPSAARSLTMILTRGSHRSGSPPWLPAMQGKRRDYGNFGLLVDLSHIPMIHETIEESILPVKDYIIHAHMGNTVIKSPDCEACGTIIPDLDSRNSENDVEAGPLSEGPLWKSVSG